MSILSRALSVLESRVSQISFGRPQHLLVCVWLSGVVACRGDGTTVCHEYETVLFPVGGRVVMVAYKGAAGRD